MRAPHENQDVMRRLKNISMGGINLVLAAGIPELQHQPQLLDRIYDDLLREKLVEAGNNTTMSAQGFVAKRTTPIGDAFLGFISDPPALRGSN
jgi:c-di-GMP-binding flagellar brake protein YcgR